MIFKRKARENEVEYFQFLNELRKSGATNMFGASPYLTDEYGLSEREAVKILKIWMANFTGKTITTETIITI